LVSALIDTGVLLDYLAGNAAAKNTLEQYPQSAISVLTWVEIMTLAPPNKEVATRDFLRRFERLAFNEAIADRATQLARAHPSMPLPFAVAYATARINSIKFVTADPPGELHIDSSIEVPYRR
jgi:predicted nucleic acid-binding protein